MFTLIFLHTYFGSSHFLRGVQNFEVQYLGGGGGGGLRKINVFWGIKILWIFFRGHHKIGLYLVVISMHFRVFS